MWNKISWKNYIKFLECTDNIERFILLGGIDKKKFMNDDKLALELLKLDEDKSFMKGKKPKSVIVKGVKYNLSNKVSFAYGLVALDVINKFIDTKEYVTEKLFAELAALHCAKDFNDEEQKILIDHFNNMSVADFWPIGNFFFQKYSKLLNSKIISENNALLSTTH